jgi:phosphatidylglycerol:prolipoprotein diacylglycerol transferase
MYPTLFHLPIVGWPIYGYGLMMVAAFLATQRLSSRLAKSRGIDPEIFVNVTLIALVTGVIGSRLSHVLENASIYFNPKLGFWTDLWNIVNIRSGGLTFYGGFILASPAVVAYVMYRKVPVKLTMDIVAPCLMLGLGIGRLGCFLNGCCYGAPANVPWAVSFPYNSNAYISDFEHGQLTPPPELLVAVDRKHSRLVTNDELARGYVLTNDPENPQIDLAPNARQIAAAQHAAPVHPAELYSTLTALLIMAVLLCYFELPHAGGRVFALMLMLEGPTRYLLEMLRVEDPVLGKMSLSMVIGLILFVIGVVLWFAFAPKVAEDQGAFAVGQPA